MSTLAVWLLVALAALFVVMVVVVVLALRSLARKSSGLSREMDGLLADLDTAVRSVTARSPDEAEHHDGRVESQRTYSGYHRRDAPRQEEVDHG
ncbi:hypothetical protein CLV30_111168 [Haloactinopolyspora alba]|uniref:Uncharacterized protein n=1 Tax=Haloactinopolyspora alba TaxID=648780 RepID=A0A2P8DYE2_9ACTN|nr:hypothetical protein CLV30_111168 [Haloactinopolyspora alba]